MSDLSTEATIHRELLERFGDAEHYLLGIGSSAYVYRIEPQNSDDICVVCKVYFSEFAAMRDERLFGYLREALCGATADGSFRLVPLLGREGRLMMLANVYGTDVQKLLRCEHLGLESKDLLRAAYRTRALDLARRLESIPGARLETRLTKSNVQEITVEWPVDSKKTLKIKITPSNMIFEPATRELVLVDPI